MSGFTASRGRIVLITLSVLLLLDLGRSLYARIGYARPLEIWQPEPTVYADLTWPPGTDLPATAPLGQRVYAQRCAVCHGPDGRGNGPAAPSLVPRPRDFTQGQFKYKSTAAGQPPTDADLIRVVRDGLAASAMPYWRDILNDAEIRAVVDFVKSLSPVFAGPSPEPVAVPARGGADQASIARGRVLFQASCASCHAPTGNAGTVLLKDAKGYPVPIRDLTAPWTFRGGATPEQLWLRLTTGMAPGPMPSFAFTLNARQRWDVVNFVLSLARTPPWETGGRLDAGPGLQADLEKRGRYLVQAQMCGLCHTPINRTGIYRGDDFYLAGGMRVGMYPHGFFISRNLTSDPETGLGRWTEEEIGRAMTTGHARGRILNLWDMPWMLLSAFREEDARAIARYLKTLPPVYHRIPDPLRYGIVETIAIKLTRPLPAVDPPTLSFADGHFGATNPGRLSRDLPQRLLIWGQWLFLALGTFAYMVASRRDARRRSLGRRLLSMLGVLGLIILGLIGWALYDLPALRIIPPEQISGPITRSVPRVSPATFPSSEQAGLAERGRTLFTVGCALCHGQTGAGGAKISWKPMGSLFTRNITSDPQAGIGRWSDAEIARAIRSGVSRDGRALHWQGMIWDHASNWDEEDIRAIITFLRTLPPESRTVPAPRPPAPDDCDVYTFFVEQSTTPGCR